MLRMFTSLSNESAFYSFVCKLFYVPLSNLCIYTYLPCLKHLFMYLLKRPLQKSIMDSDDNHQFRLIPEHFDVNVSDNIRDVQELLPVDSFVEGDREDITQVEYPAPDQHRGSQESSGQLASAPAVLRRSSSSSVNNYLRSPSARRVPAKSTHCFFCQRNVTKENLERHLASNDQCASLYKRKLKVRSLDSVLCLSFFCLFCSCSGRSLKLHLEQSHLCMESYCNKFQVGNIRFVNLFENKIIKLLTAFNFSYFKADYEEG